MIDLNCCLMRNLDKAIFCGHRFLVGATIDAIIFETFMTFRKPTRLGLAVSLIFLTAACASKSANVDPDVNDPYEDLNRKIFAFNKSFDRQILRPISSAYQFVMPDPLEDGVSNAMRNLREPWVFVNDILQLKFKRALTTLMRFTVNSTVGVAGLLRVSDGMGVPYHSEDLGQTLAVWGFKESPYFIIPFIGPSTNRDFIGFAGYFFLDPVTIALNNENESGLVLLRAGVDALDARVRLHDALDDLYEEDDPYVVMRSLYFQNRRYEIYDGDPPANEAEEDFFDALEEEEEGTGQ